MVRVGVARPTPFTLSTITSKVVVYALDERAGTLPLFLFYPYMYSVENIVKIFKSVNVFITVSCLFQKVGTFHLAIMGILTMHFSVSGAVVLLGGVLLLAPVFTSLWLLGLFWAERLWGAAHNKRHENLKRDSHEILIGWNIKLNARKCS